MLFFVGTPRRITTAYRPFYLKISFTRNTMSIGL
uniref:Uncharacterized protein n=1 Tax=Arundo donax TaxID=35708 RepID=A0A0A9AMP0_ARUDO